MGRAKRSFSVCLAALALTAGACSGGDESPQAPSTPAAAPTAEAPAEPGQQPVAVASLGDAAKGEKIYGNVCAVCHGPDPTSDGPSGPAIAGSPLELVEAKVVRGEYPPGYTPKRGSAVMPPLPYLKDVVPDIAAYLQAAGG